MLRYIKFNILNYIQEIFLLKRLGEFKKKKKKNCGYILNLKSYFFYEKVRESLLLKTWGFGMD